LVLVIGMPRLWLHLMAMEAAAAGEGWLLPVACGGLATVQHDPSPWQWCSSRGSSFPGHCRRQCSQMCLSPTSSVHLDRTSLEGATLLPWVTAPWQRQQQQGRCTAVTYRGDRRLPLLLLLLLRRWRQQQWRV
jgi:hypothetical protein